MFPTQEARARLDSGGEIVQPGDLCYLVYKEIKKAWDENPRWTTAHNLKKNLVEMFNNRWWFDWQDKCYGKLDHNDFLAARDLAWEVFFALEVVPYELDKREENGEIGKVSAEQLINESINTTLDPDADKTLKAFGRWMQEEGDGTASWEY
jgi:hypothetical protein